MSEGAFLEIYAVFAFPLDFPGHYVVRRFHNATPTDWFRLGLTLEDVRKEVPGGLVRFARHPEDEPHIVETWL